MVQYPLSSRKTYPEDEKTMPVIKSAIKKFRQDKVKQKKNDLLRDNMSDVLRKAKKTKTDKAVSAAFSVIDKAAKKGIIHKNKAARMKAALVKKENPGTTTTVKPTKKAVSKSVKDKQNKKKTAAKK